MRASTPSGLNRIKSVELVLTTYIVHLNLINFINLLRKEFLTTWHQRFIKRGNADSMPLEITTNEITAASAIAALVVTIIIAWRQISIQNRQAAIQEEQAGYQKQQTNISKLQTDIAGKQAAIMETQTRIASQQLDIITDQERERQRDRLRAKFEARITRQKMGNHSIPCLQIENKGPADARDIEMSLIDAFSELPVGLSHEVPPEISSIPSGSSLNFRLIPCMDDPIFYYLKIRWVDGLDEQHLERIPFRL
jgi:hypothetical protein